MFAALDFILLLLYSKNNNNDTPVKDVMTKTLTTLSHAAHKDELAKVLNAGLVAIVEDAEGNFEGLITRIDFIITFKNMLTYEIQNLLKEVEYF